VGRAPGNHLVIEHPDISKLHARLLVRPEGLAVADAGSSNGTLVNGARIPLDTPWPLRDRDLVSFGSAHLQYLLSETLLALMKGA
jgi:pSer/pThr/pTyr-binding forkhead associated (FHA) protein